MSFNFNADEIFQLGVLIETMDKILRAVAKNASDPPAQKLFLDFPDGVSHIELLKN